MNTAMDDTAGADQPGATAVQALLDQVQSTGLIHLTALSMLDLCALDGPEQALFDEHAARLWYQFDEAKREDLTRTIVASLAERGLLFVKPEYGEDHGTNDRYDIHPTLGLVMAARSRPSFVVVCAVDGHERMAEPHMYALGDQIDSVRGIVVEWPASVPEKAAALAKAGPFGRLNRYMLVTPVKAAAILAEWAIKPAPKRSFGKAPARTVALFRHDEGHDAMGAKLTVHGDGTRARLTRQDGTAPHRPITCDQLELGDVIHNFLGIRQV